MSCLRPTPPACPVNSQCPDKFGCIPGVCPNFIIKRFDTLPPFRYSVTDDDGDPIDLTGLVLEANMWANASLRSAITATDTSIRLMGDIGFEQSLVDDIIIMSRVRSPEHMRITGFDEANKLVFVERGVNGTTPSAYARNTCLKIFRFISSPGETEMVYDDVQQVDGTILCDQLIESFLVYNWNVNDTCVPGCFHFEFKLLSIDPNSIVVPSVIPQCFLGIGVQSARRYPLCGDFIIKICDTPTAEI